MELFRVGEVLLRPPLLPFLAPAAFRLPQRSRVATSPIKQYRRTQRRCQTSLLFSTSASSQQEGPAETQSRTPQEFPSSPAPQGGVGEALSSLFDQSLNLDKDTPVAPATRTSRFSPRNSHKNNPPPRGQANELAFAKSPASKTPLDDLIGSMESKSSNTNMKGRTRDSFAQMIDPFGFMNRQPNSFADQEAPFMKLGPKVGRTVQVNNARNMDVGRAFRTLEIQCSRNSVRKDFNRQRFHERPGLKRKRLKSERWRKNFKNQFKATVHMVQQMKRQGW